MQRFYQIKETLCAFERIQLNVMFQREQSYIPRLANHLKQLPKAYQIIIQLNGKEINIEVGKTLQKSGIDVVYLHDRSGGHGKNPEQWEGPVGDYCGYAGGLSPDSLEDAFSKIVEITDGTDFWLDMESGIRTEDDQLDLQKVEAVLQLAKSWVNV